MAITPLPSLDRTSATFKTDLDTFFGSQIPTFCTEMNTSITDVNNSTVAAAASEAAASLSEASALAAANTAAVYTNLTGTSTSSVSITVASGKVFTTQSGKSWVAGMRVRAYANSTNYMDCVVTSYTGTTLTLNCTNVVGSGSFASWGLFPMPPLVTAGLFTEDTTGYSAVSVLENIQTTASMGMVCHYIHKATSQFVGFAVSTVNTCTTSPDGLTWTLRTLPSSAAWQLNAVIGDYVLAAVSNSTTGAISTDGGVTWAATTLPHNATYLFRAGNVFVLVLAGASVYYTSPNGTTWTSRNVPFPSAETQRGLAKQGSTIVSLGYNSANAYTSTDDGLTWTKRTLPASKYWTSVATNGSNLFCAVNLTTTASGMAATSADGITWTSQTIATSTNGMSSVCWGNSLFCAVGNTGACYTSPTGVTWTLQSSAATAAGSQALYCVCRGSDKFVAVGGNGVIITSADGVTWAARTSGVALSLNHVCWTGTRYVVVGNTGTILTSTDGITWSTSTASGIADYIYGVSYGNSKVIAFSGSGSSVKSLISTDNGLTWSVYTTSSGTYGAYGSIWTGTTWINNGECMQRSTDGYTWNIVLGFSTTYSHTKDSPVCMLTRASTYGSSYLRSTDGINWSSGQLPGVVYSAPAYGADAGEYTVPNAITLSEVYRSTDCITWTSHSVSLANLNYVPVKVGTGYVMDHATDTGLMWTGPTISGPWTVRTFTGCTFGQIDSKQLSVIADGKAICLDGSSSYARLINMNATALFTS